jgi:hypothetical protein
VSGILRAMRHPGRRPARLLKLGLLVMLPTLCLWAAPAPTLAADGGLVVLAQTRYEVLPAQHRVHVNVDAVATSYEPDTPEGQVYYSGVTFAVQPGATNVAAFAGGQQIGARITERNDDFTGIEVTFGRGVFFRQSYAYLVSFDLVDPGGAGTRDLRIGESLAAFPVWAFGTGGEPGSSVEVLLPMGYNAAMQGNEMRRSELPGGNLLLRAEPSDPQAFFVYLTADRPGAFDNQSMRVDVNGISTVVLIRAWKDDPDWARRVTRLLRRGLPMLQDLIGLDYPGRQPRRLTVEEAATSRLGEYAGIYDPVTSQIRVRYDADAFVTLHEAAHIWFNGTLFEDRWINEAWAEFYGVTAGRALGERGGTFELTEELLDARIPLNDWGAIGVESLLVEDFAYSATYSLARDIARRTDLESLELVWVAASSTEPSYQPIHGPPEPGSGLAMSLEGWKVLLDLLEERTGARYADLWREWVVDDQELPLIAKRQSSRHHYSEVVAAAGAWELPAAIRDDLGGWRFDEADVALTAATDILEDRDAIVVAAADLELTAPSDLRQAFEGDGLKAAASEAEAELETLEVLADGSERLGVEPQLLESIGLIGSDPAAQLERARDSFEDGDLEAARGGATEATTIRAEAADAGRLRVVAAGSLVLVLDGVGMGLGLARRRRRRVALAA